MNTLINAVAHVHHNYHLSIIAGLIMIVAAMGILVYVSILAVHDFIVVRRRYQRARTCMRYLPYPMRRVRN